MTVAPVELESPAGGRRITVALFLAAFAAVWIAGEMWSKWWPYAHKAAGIASTGIYPGHSILRSAGPAGAAPSWSHAWHFTVTYGRSVWMALVAALVIGAALQSFVPGRSFGRIFGREGLRGSLTGALAALPCLMCTCCGAPVTNSMRRSGASRSASLAYWLGNPLLNPAVMVFLLLVLPWRFALTRLIVGAVLVVGGSALLSRVVPGGAPGAAPVTAGPARGAVERPRLSRFARALARMVVVLVPEYFVVVVGIGALGGWLMPLGHDASGWGLTAVLVMAAAGTLLVIPTGAEIPVILALAAAGFGTGVLGAALIALPAVSLPSMVMVGRDLSWRVVAATAAAVVVSALVAALLLGALT